MTTLLLRLAAPLQSWGTSSRFSRRGTDRMPSKSGIVGLLAAAQGRRRTDPLDELLGLQMAVRIDQPGRIERDFQTAARPGERTPISVSTRRYLADAVFLVGLHGEDALLEGLHAALRHPHFPLYLGRRSCPPVGRVEQGLRSGEAVQALSAEPWRATPWFQRRWDAPTADLELVGDCLPGTTGAALVRDQPVSFNPRHRQWEWRAVLRHPPVEVSNPMYPGVRHDPLVVL
ncbi:type I-E CRISPR-associated protein Cas5/CasD [Pseudonocardia yunnanensis]|uniref:Type I-E CRISPR-associated protein Cas5/CasD n=1 Tax=Pseudonocardia yunnanensis TaxID=58107 RepID=A0ABW4F8Q9_9PSEU